MSLINWLINNEFSIEKNILWEENRDLWEKIIPMIYYKNYNFKNFVDFIFMFDRLNFKVILLGCILFLSF